jgi:hypothetical protein
MTTGYVPPPDPMTFGDALEALIHLLTLGLFAPAEESERGPQEGARYHDEGRERTR